MTVRKQGNQYFAQREGEPSIYELEVKSVADVRDAATKVKESSPETKKK